MNVYVLNTEYEPIAVIDAFKSLIWTKRYFTCGDFELYVPADESLLQYLQPDYFLTRDDDDSVMIIERLEIQTDVENGDFYIVSGRSIESVLARRIVASLTVVDASEVVQGIKQLIVRHTDDGDPSSFRAIPGLVIDDSLTLSKSILTQFTGDVLLDAVTSICTRFGIGLKMTLSGSTITLSFYEGSEVDVIFSPEFDNMLNSKYVFDTTNYANYAKIHGEGQGTSRIGVSISGVIPTPTGFALRELYVDARDMSPDGGAISSGDYILMLAERGREKLAQHAVTQSFEAEIEPQTSFRYKIDYNLGDIVTVTNEYGVTAKPRIVEIIESWDDTGYKAVPTFDALEVSDKIVLKDSEGYTLKDSTGAILTVKE